MKHYYFDTLKALWDGQNKIKMFYGMSRVKQQLPGKRSITYSPFLLFAEIYICNLINSKMHTIKKLKNSKISITHKQ